MAARERGEGERESEREREREREREIMGDPGLGPVTDKHTHTCPCGCPGQLVIVIIDHNSQLLFFAGATDDV